MSYRLLAQVLFNTSASAALLIVLLRWTKHRSPGLRLALCWSALVSSVAVAVPGPFRNIGPFEVAALNSMNASPLLQRIVVSGWICGVILMSIRTLRDYRFCTAIRRGAEKPSECAELLERFSAETNIPIFSSSQVSVPAVFGVLRPVILIPRSLHLSPAEWESVLQHERGHVSRKDPLCSMIQRGFEIVLFFSPAVWWISNTIRKERECATDDVALLHTGDPVPLAQALANLAVIAVASRGPQLGAGSNLAHRVKRLLRIHPEKKTRRPVIFALILLILSFQISLPSLTGAPDSSGVVIIRKITRSIAVSSEHSP